MPGRCTWPLSGNTAAEIPLGNARLIDGMIAKHKMQTTLTSLDDQAVNA